MKIRRATPKQQCDQHQPDQDRCVQAPIEAVGRKQVQRQGKQRDRLGALAESAPKQLAAESCLGISVRAIRTWAY